MELNWFEAIIYGLVSGISEFLPVSSRAHQAILRHLFGGGNTVVLDFLIHIAMLLSVVLSFQKPIRIINRARRILSIPRNRRKRQPNDQIVALISLLKTACWPVLLMTLLFKITDQISTRFQFMAISIAINGVVLYIVWHLRLANKDARFMSRFDGLLIGIGSGLGIIPGISRVGMGFSVSMMRGVEPRRAVEWVALVSIPAIVGLCFADIITLISVGAGNFGLTLLIKYIVSAFFAFAGTSIGIRILHFLVSRKIFGWISYYCWGLAMFAFVLFML